MNKEANDALNEFHIQQRSRQLAAAEIICQVKKLIMSRRVRNRNYVDRPIGYRSVESQNVLEEILTQIRTNGNVNTII